MLPAPATFAARNGHYIRTRALSVPGGTLRTVLLARSRLTNLAVAALAALLALSLVVHARAWARGTGFRFSRDGYGDYGPPAVRPALVVTREPAMRALTHLILVAGHAVWEGGEPADEASWVLEPMQRDGGRTIAALVKHIEKGSELALADPQSLLVFTGGHTRAPSLSSEATSYLRLAHRLGALGRGANASAPFPRGAAEPFALDSLQNVLFALARFRERTGAFPAQLTVVGFGFKRRRFEMLHARALRWPAQRFSYVGLDPAGDTGHMFAGEEQNGYAPYAQDLYGCHGALLAKRRARNPHARFHPYYTSAPELAELLDYCPDLPTQVFPGSLPWDTLS